MSITLTVNGSTHEIDAPPGARLLGVLRNQLGLLGAKPGCGAGDCGVCNVLVDDAARPSCQLSLTEVAGHRITTIEGLADGDVLHPLQQAFIDNDAMQCGYCTAGMIISGEALRRREPHPTRAQVLEAVEGNLCRCGTHNRIVRAIEAALNPVAAVP